MGRSGTAGATWSWATLVLLLIPTGRRTLPRRSEGLRPDLSRPVGWAGQHTLPVSGPGRIAEAETHHEETRPN